ncbi:16S rRNA (cytidine(1402)-2'-O)-methyltransferase [Bacillus lacus]|uniref:Ribosomal RNA small subunit methyltransferase I n=1 Tax=Metabacillus lacus TaxID=1983721 RepID=A0A7X2J069_9BACI|nr:16S rRNA (cytidine(1402)-2'-O)-methyltransferase [Metabacillus lacus]MRX72940.1 16S rRNA (cytidine(1402)-2'-O)-methyltransferase [Metabacillus lacus]
MNRQKSYTEESDLGHLYLVPTPIGNLEDMTYRAVSILQSADMIAAEDTRQTKKLCNHFEIRTPLISYHEHNKESGGYKILQLLKEGRNVALVSDAGMPIISDPGDELVKEVIAAGGYVIPLPGANAALPSLIASGIAPQPFYFFGFLDRQKKEKKKQLEALSVRMETMIFYESPHRLKETLQLMKEYFGDRNISVTRELSKKFEEFIRGTLTEVLSWAETEEIRGEFCLVVEGSSIQHELTQDKWWESYSLEEHVAYYIEENHSAKEAIKLTAVDRKLPKREVYQAYHGLE